MSRRGMLHKSRNTCSIRDIAVQKRFYRRHSRVCRSSTEIDQITHNRNNIFQQNIYEETLQAHKDKHFFTSIFIYAHSLFNNFLKHSDER